MILHRRLGDMNFGDIVDGDAGLTQNERRDKIVIHAGNMEGVGEDQDVGAKGSGTLI